MVVGTTLFKLDGNAYYSPQFPRGGLGATFVIKVEQISGAPTFKVSVEHRNEDETSWATAGTFTDITATGLSDLSVSSLKEIVRIKYAFDAGDDATDAVHFLMQAPTWRPY